MRASIPAITPTPMFAIVGIAGRFPGAQDVDVFWERVSRGDDCLADIDPAELIASGVPASSVRSPNFVLRSGRIDGVDEFDHDFFGVSRREAAVMDPQQRIMLGTCLVRTGERRGHAPSQFPGLVGVYVGMNWNRYRAHCLSARPDLVEHGLVNSIPRWQG